jgi:heat shock protein HslJ
MLCRKALLCLSISLTLIVLLSSCVSSGQTTTSVSNSPINPITSVPIGSQVVMSPTVSTTVTPTVPSKPSSVSTSDPKATSISPYDVFGFRRVIWNPGFIYMFGYANFPDRTILQTQLYKDGQPVDWWMNTNGTIPLATIPLNECWEIDLSKTGKPLSQFPSFGPGYSFRVWKKDNPDINATFNLPFPEPTYIPISELKGSSWNVISLNGKNLVAGTSADATFNIDDFGRGTIKGKATINLFGGFYETDAPNDIIVYDIMGTTMGPPIDKELQEEVYMQALHSATTYKIVNNHLEIYDNHHIKTLEFERAP